KADAIKRILWEAVHNARRGDADDVVNRGSDIVHMQELWMRRRVRLDLRRPTDGQGIARAAEVRRDQFGGFVGRATRPGPTCVVHVIGLGRTEHIETTKLIQRFDVLINRRWDAVLRQQLADGAVLPFRRRTVVAPDVEDDRVVAISEPVYLVHDAADLSVYVLGHSREQLHEPPLEGPFALGNGVP